MILFRCTECEWCGNEGEIVRFSDPESDQVWSVCPQCRAAEQFENICDEPGCKKVASCGWPSDGGYRRTCYDHARLGG